MQKEFLLVICIMSVLGSQSTFASNDSVNKEEFTKSSNSSDLNGSISISYKVDNLREIQSKINQEIILGKEYIVDTYSDGSFLSVVAEDIQTSNFVNGNEMRSSGPVYTQSRQFTYTYTNILGVKQTAYIVIIQTTFVSDVEFGYIISMTGSYNIYNSSFILSWSDLPDTSIYHAIGLDSYYYGTHRYSIFTSLYNTVTGQLAISVSDY